VIPYSVNSPLWSDGAYKERFMALPPKMVDDGQEVPAKISFTSGGWSLPEQSVLIKSFALELTEGDPRSRRWIETRFITKQQGEWAGYTYAWNEAQTDATLVEKAGRDREYLVHTAQGIRRQQWRFPSRTECMVCHSRAANFALGMTTPQLNREHDYGGGTTENQLVMLERLNLLRVNWKNEAVEALRKDLTSQKLASAEVEKRISEITSVADQRTDPPSSLLFQAPEKYDCLADPYDGSGSIEQRARSYLQVNCAQCHTLAGGGNAQFDVAIATPLEQTKLLNVRPQHHTFDVANPLLIAPGDPDRSILIYRVSHRSAGHMPPLATYLVDHQAVTLLRQWVSEMPAESPVVNGFR
jgi:mono/diheme cytochrome c family protein